MWGSGLINGMRITMRNMVRGPITVQYPHEKLDMYERSRWAVEAIFDDSGAPKCTACMACVRVCPDHILDLVVETREDKTKHIDRFTYELGACMMCGLCVEACPFAAIRMGHDYELSVTDPADLVTDLITDVDAASPKKKKSAEEDPERAERIRKAREAKAKRDAEKAAAEGAGETPATEAAEGPAADEPDTQGGDADA
jgi:formate hydrogenlyase subunit 6/NADH:ubiquinone oxidoreductase subunit I